MLRASDPRHVDKIITGSCLIAAPLVLLLGEVAHPQNQRDEAAQLAMVARNLGTWYLAHLLILLALVLFVPVILGLAHLVRERQATSAYLGGGLALLGVLAIAALMGWDGFVEWQMAQPGADRAEMAALLQRMVESPGVVVPLLVVPLAFMLGLVVLAVGLYRSKIVRPWIAGLVALGSIVYAVGEELLSKPLMLLGVAVLALGLGLIGRLVLGESDQEWEHPPQVGGIRPAPGTP